MRIRIACARLILLGLTMIRLSLGFNLRTVAAQEKDVPAAGNPKWNYDELQKAPEKDRVKQNPLENDADAVQAGGKLFERHCAECHGMKAEGRGRAPSLLRQEVQQATPGTLFWVLTNGVVWHGMPVWSKLPEQERWQIVAFLKSFRTSWNPTRSRQTSSSITRFLSVPMPDTSTSITSPGTRYFGGSNRAPAPVGVPVAMMSPG
jgi:mono/diheme cytochrome c family protein